jgi:hypothetical protein
MKETSPTVNRLFPLPVKLFVLTLLTFVLAMLGILTRAQAAPVTHTFAAIQSAAAGADYSQTATRNGYVILQAWETRRMHELKAQNPELKVLVYKNLAYSAAKPSATAPPSTGVSTNEAPSSWYLLNTAGQRVLPNGFTWMSAMDVGNREYQERWANNVISELESQGWDGVFMDDVNPTIKYAYTPSSVAKYPTDATYSAAMESAVSYIGPRIQARGKLAIANFSCWAEYHNQLNGWLSYLSGALDEMFVKWGSKAGEGYRPEGQWKEQVEEASYAAAHGKIFLGFTQGAEGEVQAARYGYASLLLGADSAASYSFIPNYSAEAWMPEFEYQIGEPTGAYRKDASGVYMREFTNGLVVVNPSTATRTVKFGGSYSGSGLTDATEATMAPDTALVLTLNGKESPTPPPVVTAPVSTPTPKPVVTAPKSESPPVIGVTVTVGTKQTSIAWNPPASVAEPVVNYEVQRNNHVVVRTKKRHRVERHVKRGARSSYRILALGKHGKVLARSRFVHVKAGALGSRSYPAAPSAA